MKSIILIAGSCSHCAAGTHANVTDFNLLLIHRQTSFSCVFLNKTACGVYELLFILWLVGTVSLCPFPLALLVTGLPCHSSCNAYTMSSTLTVWMFDNSGTLSIQAWAQIAKAEALGGQAAASGQLHCFHPTCCTLSAVYPYTSTGCCFPAHHDSQNLVLSQDYAV